MTGSREPSSPRSDRSDREKLPLSDALQQLLEECRMVLPGLQALFGFQLIAVINSAFSEKLNATQQHLHLAAIGLVAVAIALIMTPAAYHRQTTPREATGEIIRISTKLVLWSMLPLAVGICIDFYIVAIIIVHRNWVVLPAVFLFSIFVLLWFVLPRSGRLRSLLAK